jgi:hypothetical protein
VGIADLALVRMSVPGKNWGPDWTASESNHHPTGEVPTLGPEVASVPNFQGF